MNDEILIEYVNQLYVRLHGPRHILRELYEELTYVYPGYQYSTKYKSGQWDGKIRLFNARDSLLYRGHAPALLKWASKCGYDVKPYDRDSASRLLPSYKFNISWLDNWEKYSNLQPVSHQIKSINGLLSENQALLLSPTSSGKSLIAYFCVRWILENSNKKVLITTASTLLVEQLFSDFAHYSMGKWDVENNVHKIYSGQEHDTNKRVIISTWQSIYKKSNEWFEQFDAYICDEVHIADKESITSLIQKLCHCPIRIGMTGTLNGSKIHELELTGRFGRCLSFITTKELMDIGFATPLKIQAKRIIYSTQECDYISSNKVDQYKNEIDYIVGNELRNDFIVEEAMKSEGNCLVLVNYVKKHGDVLYSMFKEKAKSNGKKIYYIKGDIPPDERERMRIEMDSQEGVILVATYQTLAVGVSLPSIEHIFFAHPYKARIKNLQSIGRGLRKKEGKKYAIIHDYGDDFIRNRSRSRMRDNHLLKHFKMRLEMYESENFDYEVKEVTI